MKNPRQATGMDHLGGPDWVRTNDLFLIREALYR